MLYTFRGVNNYHCYPNFQEWQPDDSSVLEKAIGDRS